jgi:hypothetical protein
LHKKSAPEVQSCWSPSTPRARVIRRASLSSQRAKTNGAHEDAPLQNGAVLVVSGGARGVTGPSLLALVERISPRLALLGRSEMFEEAQDTRGAADEAALKKLLTERARQQGHEVDLKAIGDQARPGHRQQADATDDRSARASWCDGSLPGLRRHQR